MSRVVFSVTDVQVRTLRMVRDGSISQSLIDERSLSSLERRGWISGNRYRCALTPMGEQLLRFIEQDAAVGASEPRGALATPSSGRAAV